MDFVNFFSSWSRTFKPTKISHFFFFYRKRFRQRSHLSQKPISIPLCVCVRVCSRTTEPHCISKSRACFHDSVHSRKIQACVSTYMCTRAHTHTPISPWMAFFIQTLLYPPFKSIQCNCKQCVCLLIIVCENIFVEKKKKRQASVEFQSHMGIRFLFLLSLTCKSVTRLPVLYFSKGKKKKKGRILF